MIKACVQTLKSNSAIVMVNWLARNAVVVVVVVVVVVAVVLCLRLLKLFDIAYTYLMLLDVIPCCSKLLNILLLFTV